MTQSYEEATGNLSKRIVDRNESIRLSGCMCRLRFGTDIGASEIQEKSNSSIRSLSDANILKIRSSATFFSHQ